MAIPLDQLILKRASPAQISESRKRTAVEWADWIDFERYIQREEECSAMDHANDDKQTVWVLTPANDPETLEFLCAVETFVRPIFILPPNETNAVSDVGYHIASVFTPPKYRKNSYATRMMSLLHFAIAKPDNIPPFPTSWGHPAPLKLKQTGIVSAMYSDLGRFYEKCAPGEGIGWTLTSHTTTEWDSDNWSNVKYPAHVELLSRSEAAQTVAGDIHQFKRDLEAKGPSSHTRFAFQPTEAWCQYQMSQNDKHPLYEPPPQVWGARMDYQGVTHFIVWKYDASSKRKLFLLSVRAIPETFPDLLAAVKWCCQSTEHTAIEAWNMEEDLISVASNLGGRTYARERPLPAIRWYGEPGEVEWLGNTE